MASSDGISTMCFEISRQVRDRLLWVGLLLGGFPSGLAQADAGIEATRLYARCEIALVELGYRLDAPDGFPDEQSERAVAALQGSLGLPPDTPLTPAFVAAVAAMAEARRAGMLALSTRRRELEARAVLEGHQIRPLAAMTSPTGAPSPVRRD